MKEIITKVFKYSELSDKAKERARIWYMDRGLDYYWWESIYEDAARIGLKITSFDLDRNRHCTGTFTKTEQQVAQLVIENHGKDCETYKTCKTFLENVNEMPETTEKNQLQWNEICYEFLESILEDYSILLQKEYEYLYSDKCVEENITANEYTFTADGKRFE